MEANMFPWNPSSTASRRPACLDRRVGSAGCERSDVTGSLVAVETADDWATTVPLQRIPATSQTAQVSSRLDTASAEPAPTVSSKRRRGVHCVYQTSKKPLVRQNEDTLVNAEGPSSDDGSAEPAVVSASTERDCTCPEILDDRTATLLTTSSVEAPTLLACVEDFFRQVYALPSYSFLHPATIRAKAAAGTLDAALTAALCGVARLHPPSTSCSCRGTALIQRAESLLWQNLEFPTISRLQALLLVVNHRMESGHFQRSFMLAALAARFVTAMGIHRERPGLPFVQQEVCRRIVWSLKLTERYFSHGLPEFELCPFEVIYLQLPCREDDFSFEGDSSSGHSPTITNHSDGGSYNLCVNLEALRRDIMKMNWAAKTHGDAGLLLLMHQFEEDLTRIGSQFPHGPDLLSSSSSTPWTARHVLMRLSWHQCYCDIYRLLLPGFQEAAPPTVLAAVDTAQLAHVETQCLRHASAIIDLLTSLNQISTRPHLLEFDNAICVYQATLILLFIARFGKTADRPTPEFATSRADLCLAALTRFFPASALVKPILDELQRVIHAFAAASSSNPGSSRGSSSRSPAASTRDRLAIHSLLRRADFTDGEDGDEATPALLEATPSQAPIDDFTGISLDSSGLSDFYANSSPGSADDIYTLQFPLFSSYRLQEQDWSNGNFS